MNNNRSVANDLIKSQEDKALNLIGKIQRYSEVSDLSILKDISKLSNIILTSVSMVAEINI